MNERIRELAKWAGYNGHYATEEFDVDEFARLIVQECVNVMHDNELWNRHISHVLKEHFGVEE